MTRKELAEMCENDWITRSNSDPSQSAFMQGFLEGLDAGFSIKDPAKLAKYDRKMDEVNLANEQLRAEESARAFNEWRNNHPRTVMTKAEFDRRVFAQLRTEHLPGIPTSLEMTGTFPGYGKGEDHVIQQEKPQQSRISTLLQSIFQKFEK